MLLGRVNGRTVQREWGRQKLYTKLDEKCKNGDLLGDEEVDVGWVLLKWAVEKCAVRMGGGQKWPRIVVNKGLSIRFSQNCEKRL